MLQMLVLYFPSDTSKDESVAKGVCNVFRLFTKTTPQLMKRVGHAGMLELAEHFSQYSVSIVETRKS